MQPEGHHNVYGLPLRSLLADFRVTLQAVAAGLHRPLERAVRAARGAFPLRHRALRATTSVTVLMLGLMAAPSTVLPAHAATTNGPSVTFDTNWSALDWGNQVYPSNQQCPSGQYTVPAGLDLVLVTAVGGVGTPGSPAAIDPTGHLGFLGINGGGNGGQAAKVSAIFSVHPGDVLNVVTATDAGSPVNSSMINWSPAGGYGGGGASQNRDHPVRGGVADPSHLAHAHL